MVGVKHHTQTAKANDATKDISATAWNEGHDAVDLVNLHLAPSITDIANMSGSTGSKTVTLTSRQKAAVKYAARAIYASFYMNADAKTSLGNGGLSISQTDMLSNQTVLNAIKTAATQLSLSVNTDLPIVIGKDNNY